MNKFSETSKRRLLTCDVRIQRVFNEVIKVFDCTVLEGYRPEALQNQYYIEGKSKVQYPGGKHNTSPSMAIDAMPYPVDWEDLNRICYFAGFVMATAASMGIPLRWGKDWDRDTDLNDQKFKDGPHYELV